MLENSSGVCLSSLKCKSHLPKQIYAQGGGGTLIHGIYNIYCLCCGKGHGFEVGYQFSPVDVTHIVFTV